MKAILLAGGKGTRLRPLTLHTPKPIVPIFDRPFLRYQIDLLKQVPEIDEIVLSLNYQPRRIEEVFGDGDGLGIQHPLRRRAGAARHRRRDQVTPATSSTEPVVVFNGDVLTAGRPAGRDRAAPRAQGQGDDRADAGRQSDAPTGWSRPTPTATCSASSRSRSPTRSPATRSTPASTCSSRRRSTASRRTRPGRSSAATSRRWSSAARRSSPTSTSGYWIDIGTPEKYIAGAPRHHGRPLLGAAVRRRRHGTSIVAGGADRGWRDDRRARASSTRARSSRPARTIGPYTVIGRSATSRSRRVVDGAIVWPNAGSAARPSSTGRSSAATATSAATPIVEPAARSSATRSVSPTTSQLATHDHHPDIFKAYDVRGLYPSEINETLRTQIGRALRRLSQGQAIAVSRDMRVSSPALAEAFIDGAREQGATSSTTACGDRHDVLRRRPRRPRRRRADHRVAQPERVQRHQDGAQGGVPAVSGDAGIGEIRDMIVAKRDAAAAPPRQGR